MARIGVIGAGIAGLTAAYRLSQDAHSVLLFEADERPGGVIGSIRRDGFLVETGPNSLRSTPFLHTLVQELNLEEERVWADDRASRRYVVRDGRPVPIPTSVPSFLTTDLLSPRAKLRLMGEPFVPARSNAPINESLADFTRRRLGAEVLDYAVAPFVGGVYAGDPEQLSARHTFDQLVEWEEDYGSLFWGALRDGSDSSDDVPSGLFSFRTGLETLPRALADRLDVPIRYEAPVTGLHKHTEGWQIQTDPSPPDVHEVDGVVCTMPLHRLRGLDFETPVDCTPLDQVEYPPVRVVALGYERGQVDHPLDGFGMLVPPVETDFDVLGTLFSSSLFPGRAPEGHVLLTTFVGGARAPDLARRDDPVIRSVVERDLNRLLGVNGDPGFSRHIHWTRAIPQYTQGYGAVKKTLDALETDHPGLVFAGNYRQGVSVGDAAQSGRDAAVRLLDS